MSLRGVADCDGYEVPEPDLFAATAWRWASRRGTEWLAELGRQSDSAEVPQVPCSFLLSGTDRLLRVGSEQGHDVGAGPRFSCREVRYVMYGHRAIPLSDLDAAVVVDG